MTCVNKYRCKVKKCHAYVCTQVAYTTAVRAERYHGNVPPHYFEFEQNASDPYERVVGTQVFLDILLLAKCDHFLHAESSVASLASYFNPHMKSYFMEPGKYDKVHTYQESITRSVQLSCMRTTAFQKVGLFLDKPFPLRKLRISVSYPFKASGDLRLFSEPFSRLWKSSGGFELSSKIFLTLWVL